MALASAGVLLVDVVERSQNHFGRLRYADVRKDGYRLETVQVEGWGEGK